MESIELTVARVRFETSELGVTDQERVLRDVPNWVRVNNPQAYWTLVWLAAQQKWRHLYE
jgi:hypothetical protein